MKYIKGTEEINVTQGVYESIYKNLGYEPVEKINEEDNNQEMTLEELKIDELRKLAEEKEIEGFEKMKKAELVEALRG